MACMCTAPGPPASAAELKTLTILGTSVQVIRGVAWIGPGPYAAVALQGPIMVVDSSGIPWPVGAIFFGQGTAASNLNGGRMSLADLIQFEPLGHTTDNGDGSFTVQY